MRVPSLPLPVSSLSESPRAAKSLRSIVTLPPAQSRSLPFSRTRSATMMYGSAGLAPAGVVRVLDPGPAGGEHLHGVAHPFDHPEVVEGRAGQSGAGLEVPGGHPAPRLPLLAVR